MLRRQFTDANTTYQAIGEMIESWADSILFVILWLNNENVDFETRQQPIAITVILHQVWIRNILYEFGLKKIVVLLN